MKYKNTETEEGMMLEILFVGTVLSIAGIFLGSRGIDAWKDIKIKEKDIEMVREKGKAKMEIEAQRRDGIREILTDVLLEKHSEERLEKIKALKPYVEVVAAQTKADEERETMELEHRQRLEGLDAQSAPFERLMRRAFKLGESGREAALKAAVKIFSPSQSVELSRLPPHEYDDEE